MYIGIRGLKPGEESCAHCGRGYVIYSTLSGERLYDSYCSSDCYRVANHLAQPRRASRPPPIVLPKCEPYSPARILRSSP